MLTAEERSRIFGRTEEQLRRNVGEQALAEIEDLISAHPEDRSLLYLATRICNVLGHESEHRERLFQAAAWSTPAPAEPPFQFLAPAIRDPLLSLVASTWNRANSLSRLLDSLDRHTGVPFELIVSDNNSTDGTVELITQRRTTFPWLGALLFSGPCSTLAAYRAGTRCARRSRTQAVGAPESPNGSGGGSLPLSSARGPLAGAHLRPAIHPCVG